LYDKKYEKEDYDKKYDDKYEKEKYYKEERVPSLSDRLSKWWWKGIQSIFGPEIRYWGQTCPPVKSMYDFELEKYSG